MPSSKAESEEKNRWRQLLILSQSMAQLVPATRCCPQRGTLKAPPTLVTSAEPSGRGWCYKLSSYKQNLYMHSDLAEFCDVESSDLAVFIYLPIFKGKSSTLYINSFLGIIFPKLSLETWFMFLRLNNEHLCSSHTKLFLKHCKLSNRAETFHTV